MTQRGQHGGQEAGGTAVAAGGRERIRLARLTRELTQDQLAAAAGVSGSFVSLLEGGQAGGCDVIRLWRIADALGVRVIDLLMPPGWVVDRIEQAGR